MTPGARDLALLTGAEAGDVLAAAVAPVGGEVVTWRAYQVDHQPRGGSAAAYRVRVRWRDGRVTEERFGAVAGDAPAGGLTLGDGQDRVTVWRFPHDPFLPALASAYDTEAVRALLHSFGVRPDAVSLRLRAYRPRRRAVVEVAGGDVRVFLKVVRPARVEPLHRRHRLFTAAGVPSPPSLGYTDDGLMVLQALPGSPLRRVLVSGGASPSGDHVLELLERLPPEVCDAGRRRTWRERAEHYAEVVAGVLPEQATRVRALGAEVAGYRDDGAAVPVHGDFYENQLHVTADGRICGLLDIDTAGAGDRLDDLACLLGHLSVLAQIEQDRARDITVLGSRYLAAFDRVVDPVALRYRAAAVVLSLATGPHRVQERGWPRATRDRVGLVDRWVRGARTTGGRRRQPG